MNKIIQQLSSLILPITVLIIIPLLIEEDWEPENRVALAFGSMLICLGLYLMTATITAFITVGKGTLAPWSPTSRLVYTGMYAYVRNPMISGVMLVLSGESLILFSFSIMIWTILFFLINNFYFTFIEEPGLEKRFGEEYLVYKTKVPRWIPNRKPFIPQKKSEQ